MLTNILADKRRLFQIMLNFISNSLRLSKNGGYIKIHVDVLEEQLIEDKEINIQR